MNNKTIKKNVLLVEDEYLIAFTEKNLLENYGYNVFFVENGEKAIEFVKNNSEIDLILMDIDLGKGIDGTETAKIILQNKDIPVVFLSSHTEPEVVEKTEKITSYGYIVKNSSITVIDASIKMALKLFKEKSKTKVKEKELKISEQRFHELFKNMSSCVAIYKAVDDGNDFELIDFNSAGEKTEKIDRSNIIGKRVTKIFPTVKELGILSVYQRVWKTGTPEKFPFSQYKDNKTSSWRENYIYKLPSGEIVSLYDDKTDQKKYEEKIKIQNEILEATNQELSLKSKEIESKNEELESTVEELRITSEELESKNEELELAVEELRITSEELESVNEELRLANDELKTSNDKLLKSEIQLKQSGEKLRKSELEKSLILENANVGIAYHSIDMHLIWANKTYIQGISQVIGSEITLENIKGQQKCYQSWNLKKFCNECPVSKAIHTGKSQKGELTPQNQDDWPDTQGSWLVYAAPVRNAEGIIIGVIEMAHDITESKKLEIQLKESEERFKSLHNASFGGITIHDKGIILECNQGLSDITGYSISELIGMNGLLLISEKSREKVMKNILSGYEKPYEAIGVRKNGEEYPIRLEARNVMYKNKKVRTVEFRDITDQKQAEEKIKSLLSEKEMMLNETHHRIKNNMNVIRSILSMEANIHKNDKNSYKVLNDCANRMLTMSTLYDYLYHNEIRHEMDISYYVKNLIQQFLEIYKNKALNTEVHIQNINLKPVMLSRIGIIINELFTNSVKYAFDGINQPIISLSITQNDDMITLLFSDNGKGLPDSVSFENPDSFGLKLISILVRQINGTIKVERQSGTKYIIQFKK